MNDRSCDIRPRVSPDVPEWGFPDGVLQVVVAVPNLDDEWELWRLDVATPTDTKARACARMMLHLALDHLDATEPTNTNGVRA